MTFAKIHDAADGAGDDPAHDAEQQLQTPARSQLDLAFVRRQNQMLAEDISRLEAANRELEGLVAALTNSSSWRITRPLRGMARLLRRDLSLGQLAGWAYGRVRRPPPPLRRGRPGPVAFPLGRALIALPEVTGETPPPLSTSVSVVIPTFNAGPEFYWLLRKLQAQKGLATVEIVIVDSGSTDGTVELAEQLGCRVLRIPQEAFSHSYARNLGADNATGDLLLFTVQDAYPVGDHWLHSLARALLQPRSEAERVAAVSCAEFPRSDSELIYNAAIDTHYRFLGCAEGDRIGAMCGEDQQSLRTQGQLSDVACMIPASTFQAYRYEGRYAEDLILGVRLIRDGMRTGMLSSVKVVHSHTRPPAYHLKRAFVDLLFLAEAFPDIPLPKATGLPGTIAAAGQIQAVVANWRPEPGGLAGPILFELAQRARCVPEAPGSSPEAIGFGVPGLADWLARAAAAGGASLERDAEFGRQMFAARLEHVARYAEGVYGEVDESLAQELLAAAEKCLAATLGAQLAVHYLSYSRNGSPELEDLRSLLLAGV